MSNQHIGHGPPSPPHSNDGDFPYNGHELGLDPYTPPRSIRPASAEPYHVSSTQKWPSCRLTGSQEHYGEPSAYPMPPQPVYYSPQPTFVRDTYVRANPTGSRNVTTRSGRVLGSPMHSIDPGRVKKKKKPAKGYKKSPVALLGPLSEITKEYNTPIRDMGAWVNRSTEQRHFETTQKEGKIPRPMNSFMLYRSAYAERVKQYCRENNHQVVSQVTGQSWPLEPPEIRDMYGKFALIERDNHQAAYPDYKFAPNKTGKKPTANDAGVSDSDDDWEGSRSTKRNRSSKRDASRSLSSTPFDPGAGQFSVHYPPHPPHPSSYEAVNPHGPAPPSFQPGHYQSPMISYRNQVKEVNFGQVESLYPFYEPASGLIGMPDSNPGLFDDQFNEGVSASPPAHHVDPNLEDFQTLYQYNHYDTSGDTYPIPRSVPYGQYPSDRNSYSAEILHPSMATLTAPLEPWQQSGQAGSDFDKEFQGLN